MGSRAASVRAPAPAVWDDPEFLDVDMHEAARVCSFVSHERGPSHGEARGLDNVLELGHPVPGDDPFGRGSRDTEVVADAVWTPPAGEAETHNAMLALFRQLRGGMMGS